MRLRPSRSHSPSRSFRSTGLPIGATLLLAAALFTACDSDDPSEPELVRFDGTYVGVVDITELAPQNESRGVCCFRLVLDIANDASGDVSGSGTLTYQDPEGNEAAPPIPADVTGSTELDAVEMLIALSDESFDLAFEGNIAQDASSITGEIVSQVYGGARITLERTN